MTTQPITMFPDGADLPLMSGVPLTVIEEPILISSAQLAAHQRLHNEHYWLMLTARAVVKHVGNDIASHPDTCACPYCLLAHTVEAILDHKELPNHE